MSTSKRQAQANQGNALQSTGPRTPQGKARSSLNAVQHGVLSAKLILPGENAEQYQALLQSLLVELQPVGLLEQLLVERVAVAIWRQRRLVGAESAAVTEAQLATGLITLNRIMEVTGLPFGERDWVERIVKDLPQEQPLVALLSEITEVGNFDVDLAKVRQRYPAVWGALCRDCDVEEHMTPSQQLAQIRSQLDEVHGSFYEWLDSEQAYDTKLLRVVQAANTVRHAQAMPKHSDQLARYQSALDNEWYKCMRNLRETQKFRQEQSALNATPLAPR